MNSLVYLASLFNILSWMAFIFPSSDAFLQAPARTICKRKTSSSFSTGLYFFDFLKQNEPEKPQPEEEPAEEKESSDDPVEKIFGFFFGEKEEEPMGMKRIGRGALAIDGTVRDNHKQEKFGDFIWCKATIW
jgi:hypothetical protein